MRIAAAIVFASLASGCGMLVTEREAIQPVDTQYLSVKRATFDCSDGSRNVSNAASVSSPVFKHQIRSAWGEPDEIKVVDNAERWIYKKDRIWSGVWGFVVIIPVPFLVPTGREQMAIDFEGDQVNSVQVHYQQSLGGGCSLVPIPIPEGHGVLFGCDSLEASVDAELRSFCTYLERRLNSHVPRP